MKEIESGHFSKLKSQQTVWIADQIGRLKRNQAFGGNLYLPRIWKLGKMRFQSFSPQKSRCFPHIKYFRLRQENLLGEVTKIRAQEESFWKITLNPERNYNTVLEYQDWYRPLKQPESYYVEFDRAEKSTSNNHLSKVKRDEMAPLVPKLYYPWVILNITRPSKL